MDGMGDKPRNVAIPFLVTPAEADAQGDKPGT
jgi:hypothetical protein